MVDSLNRGNPDLEVELHYQGNKLKKPRVHGAAQLKDHTDCLDMIKPVVLLITLFYVFYTFFPETGEAAMEDSLTLPQPHFWEFPEAVAPAARSGLWYHGTISEVEYVRALGLRLSWADMNPQEGEYDFSALEHYLALAEAEDLSIVVRLTCSVVERKSPFPYADSQAPFVPEWVLQKHNPPRFKTFDDPHADHSITVAAPWDANLQEELRLFITEFGSRGFFANKRLAGVYLHGISSSYGEELWLANEFVANAEQAGMSEEKLMATFKNRIDWWSSAAGDHRNKVTWVNCSRIGNTGYDCDALNRYAQAAGLGWREGGVEGYHTHPPPDLGQSYLQEGYVSVDWSDSIRDGQRYFGEEIENRFQDLYSGISDQEQGYFAQSSLMRAAQLGMNYLWTSGAVINSAPSMFKWWTRIAGKNAERAPDALCWLREDFYYFSNQTAPWKNLEHFLFQRDLPGAITRPVMRIDRPAFYTDPPGRHYDYTARSTDRTNGSDAMFFHFDDTFRQSLNGNFSLKVYYYDNSTNAWHLEIPTAKEIISAGQIIGINDNRWKIAEFAVSRLPAVRPARTNYDFGLRVVSGGDLCVRFVRAVKAKQAGSDPRPERSRLLLILQHLRDR